MLKKQSKNKNKFLIFILPSILWATVIFTFSSLPTITTTNFYFWDFIFKKTAHLVEYGILSVLIYRSFVNYNFDSKKAFRYSLVICLIYAASDEFHQSFVPGRTPKIRDVIIDLSGSFLFTYIIVFHIQKLPVHVRRFLSRLDISA